MLLANASCIRKCCGRYTSSTSSCSHWRNSTTEPSIVYLWDALSLCSQTVASRLDHCVECVLLSIIQSLVQVLNQVLIAKQSLLVLLQFPFIGIKQLLTRFDISLKLLTCAL